MTNQYIESRPEDDTLGNRARITPLKATDTPLTPKKYYRNGKEIQRIHNKSAAARDIDRDVLAYVGSMPSGKPFVMHDVAKAIPILEKRLENSIKRLVKARKLTVGDVYRGFKFYNVAKPGVSNDPAPLAIDTDIKNALRKLPYGTKINKRKLANSISYDYSSVLNALKRLEKNGEVAKHSIGKGWFYVVNDSPMRRLVPGLKLPEAHIPKVETDTAPEEPTDGDTPSAEMMAKVAEDIQAINKTDTKSRTYTPPEHGTLTPPTPPEDTAPINISQHLTDKAKAFAWAYPDQHNDLRAFIAWYTSYKNVLGGMNF